MIRHLLAALLVMLAPIALASAQSGQRAARVDSAQPLRPSVTLPISRSAPLRADSAKAINTYLITHPKRKNAVSARSSAKLHREAARLPAGDSSAVVPPPAIRPTVKPLPPPPSLK